MPETARPIPREVQVSFVLWMVLVALILLNVVLAVLSGQGIVAVLPTFVLGLAAGYGAYLMRSGTRTGRVVAGIAGGALALLALIVLVQAASVLVQRWSEIVARGQVVGVILQLAPTVVILAVIVAATVFMFRPAASFYLS